MSKIHHDHLLRLCAHAMANGAERLSAMRFRWNISGSCTDGYHRTLFARPEVTKDFWIDLRLVKPGSRPFLWSRERGNYRGSITVDPSYTAIPLELELITPCRKCDKCRRARGFLWSLRAKAEIEMAPRTWFGTLTLSPEHQFRVLSMARFRASQKGRDFDQMDFGAQFRAKVGAFGPDLQRYLKRVRKQSGVVGLRYMLVAEAHKSGDPHFHMLVHEPIGGSQVRHKVLKDQWPFGFTKWVLAHDKRPASYLAKYLSKDAAARVRASKGYGAVASGSAAPTALAIASKSAA